jgi:uncharacterized protein YbjT (DUF2867 family)
MILVTGTSGRLGGLIFDGLSATGGVEVVAGTRAGDGRTARHINFDDPATLTVGFAGVEVLVFVSAGYAEDDVVLARHGAVVDAAIAAGVRHVIYTSLARTCDLMTIALAHRWTEARLAAAAFDVTILRNGLYVEVPVGLATRSGDVVSGAFGAGRISVVAREDLADVAVRVASETQRDLDADGRSRHAGRTYELNGVTAIGGREIAEAFGRASGRPVEYRAVSLAEARTTLGRAGLEPYQITHALSTLANAGADVLEAHRTDLPGLLPTTPRPVRI